MLGHETVVCGVLSGDRQHCKVPDAKEMSNWLCLIGILHDWDSA